MYYPTEDELFVLQAIANRVGSLRQYTHKSKILEILQSEARTEERFKDPAALDAALATLREEYLVEEDMKDDIVRLRLTTDAVKVERLIVDHLL